MPRPSPAALAAAAATAAALLTGTAVANAANPQCSSLPHPIYLQVGDTQTNLMKSLGRQLRDNTSKPLTLVFITSGSCSNISAIRNHTPNKLTMQYVPSIAEDPTWTTSSPTLPCDVDQTNGQPLDIANSALFVGSCTPDPAPADTREVTGPIQAYVLAVPEASSQTAITAEEAYFVFGFGAAGMIAPWIDVTNLFIRTVTKSTLLTWAANIGVPAAKFQGGCGSGGGTSMGCNTSDQVVAGLENNARPESALGLLGDEVYDADRAFLNVLAFRAFHQYAAYYPDKTATSHDKQNVRDGHYTVWSPTVWIEYVDSVTSTPINADADYVVQMIAGHPVTPVPSFAPDATVASVGLVPDCAMRVSREFDGGPLSLYQPPTSCTCTFEQTATQATSCATCDDSTPCATGVCREHLCEAF